MWLQSNVITLLRLAHADLTSTVNIPISGRVVSGIFHSHIDNYILYRAAVSGHFLDPPGNHPVGQFLRQWIKSINQA